MNCKRETHYYANAKFLEPFIKSAKGLAPVHKLAVVKGFRVPLEKEAQTDGSLGHNGDGKRFALMIRTHGARTRRTGQKSYTRYKHDRLCWEHVLWTLAHELAHLKHWEHTADHAVLTGKIFTRFARKARDLGIEDLSDRIPR